MIPAVLSHAKHDARLRGPNSGATLAALIFCLEYLDGSEWRAVKVEQVAVAISCKTMSAVRALRILTAARYIARRTGRPNRYRLLPAPLPTHDARRAA